MWGKYSSTIDGIFTEILYINQLRHLSCNRVSEETLCGPVVGFYCTKVPPNYRIGSSPIQSAPAKALYGLSQFRTVRQIP